MKYRRAGQKGSGAAVMTALNTNQTCVSQAISKQKYQVNYNQPIVKNLLKSTLRRESLKLISKLKFVHSAGI